MKHLKEYVMQMVQFDEKTYGYEQRQELVRCKDCKHYRKGTCSAGAGMAFPPPDDWFCADGERE